MLSSVLLVEYRSSEVVRSCKDSRFGSARRVNRAAAPVAAMLSCAQAGYMPAARWVASYTILLRGGADKLCLIAKS